MTFATIALSLLLFFVCVFGIGLVIFADGNKPEVSNKEAVIAIGIIAVYSCLAAWVMILTYNWIFG